MEVYLGRQPILDRMRKVAGYELLFRSGQTDRCDSTDQVAATSQVIANAVLGVGLDRLLGGKPAFINFDRTLLLGDWTSLLPPDKAVIEIVKSVQPDQEVLSAAHRLRQQGYALALDDCLDDERTAAFAPCVDILKVDFLQTSGTDQEMIVRRYQKLNLWTVAKKIESEPEFRRARLLGYDYFQGFLFGRPMVLQAAGVPASQVNVLRLVKQIQRAELDYRTIEELIRCDVSFSHSLLMYVNSGTFQWANRIESVQHGLVLMGQGEIRKWGWMASLISLGRSRPPALIAQALMRGRFCDAIAGSAKLSTGESDAFLLGMFSLLDAILERPLPGIQDDLAIGRNIRNALLGAAGEADPLSLVLRIVKSYEVADWHEVGKAARIIGLSADALNTCFLESSSWVETIFSPDEQTRRADRAAVPIDFRRNPEIKRSPPVSTSAPN